MADKQQPGVPRHWGTAGREEVLLPLSTVEVALAPFHTADLPTALVHAAARECAVPATSVGRGAVGRDSDMSKRSVRGVALSLVERESQSCGRTWSN